MTNNRSKTHAVVSDLQQRNCHAVYVNARSGSKASEFFASKGDVTEHKATVCAEKKRVTAAAALSSELYCNYPASGDPPISFCRRTKGICKEE